MKTVLCYGDSNTYGFNPVTGGRYDKKDRWVTILQDILGKEYEVIPEGLNGRTTAYDRQDAPWKNGLTFLQTCLSSHYPLDYVVFMLGTNDCIKEMNLSLEDIASGMEKLVLQTNEILSDKQEFLPQIIIVAPASIDPNYASSPFAYQLSDEVVEKTKQLPSYYKQVAEKYDCRFLDGSSVLEVSDFDCEHLTLNGHKTLATLLPKRLNNYPYGKKNERHSVVQLWILPS